VQCWASSWQMPQRITEPISLRTPRGMALRRGREAWKADALPTELLPPAFRSERIPASVIGRRTTQSGPLRCRSGIPGTGQSQPASSGRGESPPSVVRTCPVILRSEPLSEPLSRPSHVSQGGLSFPPRPRWLVWDAVLRIRYAVPHNILLCIRTDPHIVVVPASSLHIVISFDSTSRQACSSRFVFLCA
jgi:hypothetical protein